MTDLRIETHDESYPRSVWSNKLTSITPTTAVVNVSNAYVLVGSGFKATSVVKVNGTTVPATYVDSTHINVAAYTATAIGTVNFTVTTDGVATSPKPVTITATQIQEEAQPMAEAPIPSPIPVEELPPTTAADG